MAAPDTQKMMDLVEEKTGYRVSVLVDDTITTHASMVSARSSVKGDVGSKTIYEGARSCRNCLTFLEAKSKNLSLSCPLFMNF